MYDRKDKIILLYPKLAAITDLIIEHFSNTDQRFAVFETWRHPGRQADFCSKGISRAAAWRSWHQYGLAVDIVGLENGKWSWSNRHDWQALGAFGKSQGLVWGGDFRSVKDMVHFQLPLKIDTVAAHNIVKRDGILGLWDQI